MSEVSGNLEQEIASIEKSLAEKRALLEQQKSAGTIPEMPHPKETLHEVISEKIRQDIPQYQPSAPAAGTTPAAPQAPQVIPPELHNSAQELVNVTFNKGLSEAIKELKKIDNPALFDAFHSILVDQLYDHLLQRGKIHKL